MGWGNEFRQAYEAASALAKAVADKTLSSVADAAEAVGRAAEAAADAVADAAAAAGKAVAAGASAGAAFLGEVVNTVVGLTVTLATSLYAAVKAVFTPRPPAHTMTQACPDTKIDIYNNEYRMSLLDSTFDGAGDAKLAEAMNALRGPLSPEDQERHLQTLADARHRPVEEMRAEYEKYLQMRTEVEDRIVAKGLEPIDELKPEQAGFMGSTWQLRYGKAVGDELGVDPVFGAMLNPTGGLVGPGNRGKAPDAWYMPESVAYHGAYHDAMGYLFNYHDLGAGYNYMQSPIGLDTGNPLAGQATGIMQWSINLAR